MIILKMRYLISSRKSRVMAKKLYISLSLQIFSIISHPFEYSFHAYERFRGRAYDVITTNTKIVLNPLYIKITDTERNW